jgi:hypothetical protein
MQAVCSDAEGASERGAGVDSQASAAWRGSFHRDAIRPWLVELTQEYA